MKSIFSAISLIAVLAIWLSNAQIDKPQIYQVKNGVGFSQVSQELNSTALLILSKIMQTQLKAGYYQITENMRIIDLLDNFDNAKVKTVQITLIEGKTVQEYFTQLNQNSALKVAKNFTQTMQLSNVKPPYEGQFWADTYQINYGDSVVSLFKRAHQILQQKLAKIWLNRDKNLALKNPDEVLILASLIEKETAHNPEKPRIAGVFMRRLAQGMRLQTDPTVAYAISQSNIKLATKYNGKLSKKDLKFDSPYNTYKYSGLPPAPISSVSQASLNAATHPELGDFLYFIAKGDGTHAFAKTYKQHRLNIKKWLIATKYQP